MKQFFLAAAAFFVMGALQAQVKFEALQFSPQFPKAGQTVNFSYNATLSPLIDEKKVDVVVYLFNKKGLVAVEPAITQKGKLFSGSIKTDTNTVCITFGFSSEKEKDANGGKGYIVPVYATGNKPVKEYYSAASSLQNGYGEYLFGMSNDVQKALAVLEEGIKEYPEIKYEPGFFGTYLRTVNSAKKKEAKEIVLNELQTFEGKGNLTEEAYNLLIQWYSRDKRKEKTDSLTTAMKAAFPEGNWKRNEIGMSFNREQEPAKKLALYQDYFAKFPPTADNKMMVNNFKLQLANAYAKAKDYKSYNEWLKDLDKTAISSSYNNTAWYMAEAGENLAEAKKMSEFATLFAKNEITKPTEKKPESITKKQWAEQQKSNYAMYADTYAFILYKLGDFKTGYTYAKEAAAINKNKNAEYNERYAQLLEKVMPAATAQKEIEQFVKDGAASSKTKELLKQLYVKQKKSEEGYDAYLTNLEMAAKIKKREELAKTMITEAAPKFSLKDFEGNTVSLDGLKGKVVIVDFWATWCGPCIASMPAMKKAMEQYKTRDDVAFVFVDTWETVENKLQNATDFMKKNNYPFHVLMDDESKVVADFKVSGIPTKFIIDKTGNIRFKSVGFGGNDDALIDEVNTMIELAAK